MKALDWLGRTALLVLSGLATFAILLSLQWLRARWMTGRRTAPPGLSAHRPAGRTGRIVAGKRRQTG